MLPFNGIDVPQWLAHLRNVQLPCQVLLSGVLVIVIYFGTAKSLNIALSGGSS